MKVLYIIDKLSAGGAERVAVDLANLMHETDIDVTFLILLNKAQLDNQLNSGIKVIYINRKNKFDLIALQKLARVLITMDIVHAHMRHVYYYVRFTAILFNLKQHILLHDHIPVIPKNNLLLKFFFKPRHYIGVSKGLNDWAEKTLKLKNRCIHLLENTTIKFMDKDPQPKKEGIVIVGNIKPLKNQLFAIELAHKLNKPLTIIGKVQDEQYYDLLVHKINDLHFSEKVEFLHNVNVAQPLLKKFEFGLMTSFSESGPIVLIEYVAQSLPFIAYKTGAVSNELEHIVPECFVNDFSIDNWVKAYGNIFNYDYSNLYDSRFSPSEYVKKCIEIYTKIG